MKKIIMLLPFFVVMVFSAPINAQKTTKNASFSYRDLIWGLPRGEVRAFEKAAFYKEDEDWLSYLLPHEKSKFVTLKPVIKYGFTNDKLSTIRFEYFELHSPGSQRILDLFWKEEKFLTESYGEPARRDVQWKNRLYEDYPQFWGRALYSRDLRMTTTWDLPDTYIELQAYHDNLNYQVFYTMSDKTFLKAQKQVTPILPSAQTP